MESSAWRASALATVALWVAVEIRRRTRRHTPPLPPRPLPAARKAAAHLQLIGRTPLVHRRAPSAATRCTVLAKAEFLNPGGSSKDRVAAAIVEQAVAEGKLAPGGTIVEATAGSTGVSLALVARACGYRCHLVATDDISPQKQELIRALGAELELVKPASIADPSHPVNLARRRAEALGAGSIFANQYEAGANIKAHEETTAEEIWEQTNGTVDAFVMGAGTGGTIAGVSRLLKRRKPGVQVFLADPPGSVLCSRVEFGVAYVPEQQERTARRNRYDTVMEGVGLDRITANFAQARIDRAFRVDDDESIAMARRLLDEEGLFVGGSSGLNCVGVLRAAELLGAGKTIVTVLCDGGHRYLSNVHASVKNS